GNRGKDHIGLVLFSDKIEKVIAPGRGNPHIHSIMETLFTIESGDSKTDLNVPFSYLASSKKKGVLAFVISDFIGESFEKSLNVARKKYEIVAIRCLDKNEQHFPNVGTLRVKDIESGEFVEIDTGARFGEAISERIKLQNKMFKKHAVDVLNVNVSQSFIADVVKFFRRRMRY
ncbi:hypothetical protein HN446_00805, partial [bacterium]|nr:hypothetical protein [bacterium]